MPTSHIDNLDPDRRRFALEMFYKLANDQKGYPERMGGSMSAGFNSGLNHAQGIYTHLTEHVGDITHRMAQPHCEDHDFFYREVKKKVDMALDELRTDVFKRSIGHQLKAEYDFRKEHKQEVPDWQTWLSDFQEAAKKYAEAHGSLAVWNRAQFSAREAAVALGLLDWAGVKHELEVLEMMLRSPQIWERFAGEVYLREDGEVAPVSVKSRHSGFHHPISLSELGLTG